MLFRLRKSLYPRIIAFTISVLLAMLLVTPVLAQNDQVTDSLELLLGYYKGNNSPVSYDDWEALGLRWAGFDGSSKYTVPKDEELLAASDYARTILGSIAAGQDGAVVSNYVYKLIEMQQPDGSFETGGNTTLNQTVWAVIALDFADKNGFEVNYNRNDAVNYICSNQETGGGFDESGWGVDVDSTAHALIALAPDYQQPGKDAITIIINNALTYLYGQQIVSGGFGGWGSESPDSTAAVIEALMALGIDPLANEWIKDSKNIVDALLSYQSRQGWFMYSKEPSEWNDPTRPNRMSTCHALLALGDLARGQSKYSSILPEIKDPGDNGGNPGNVDPGQLQVSFSDLAGFDWAREAIESLATKGIIKGTGTGYEPSRNISRAEMLALLLKARGTNLETTELKYTDSKVNDWYYGFVGTASKKGWISGYPDSTFRPNNPISRNEIACLVNRIFPADNGESFSSKTRFSDQESITEWAQQAASNLHQRGIISGYPDGSFRGEGKLTRAEAAVIVYKLLVSNDQA